MGVNGYVITTRAEGTVLTGFGSTSDIFNADHENHVTHTAADFLNSWEATLAQMQATVAPITGGTLSLPAALKDDILRLRYQIALIKAKISGATTPPFWYTATADFSNGVSFSPTACRMEQSSGVDCISGFVTNMPFNTTIYDTASMHAVLGPIAPADGVYICGASLGFGDGVTQGPDDLFELRLQKFSSPSTTVIATNAIFSSTDQPAAITVETVCRFTKGQQLRVGVFQNSGSTKQPIHETDSRPAVWMALVGRG
jgi:hypothetical protein